MQAHFSLTHERRAGMRIRGGVGLAFRYLAGMGGVLGDGRMRARRWHPSRSIATLPDAEREGCVSNTYIRQKKEREGKKKVTSNMRSWRAESLGPGDTHSADMSDACVLRCVRWITLGLPRFAFLEGAIPTAGRRFGSG